MATSDPPPARRNPFGIVLGVAFLLALLFWAFLCTRPADDDLSGGSDVPAGQEPAAE
jgi:hypothetical protein